MSPFVIQRITSISLFWNHYTVIKLWWDVEKLNLQFSIKNLRKYVLAFFIPAISSVNHCVPIMLLRQYLYYAVLLLMYIYSISSNAQVKIGLNATSVNKNAVLEVESNSRGMLLPRISLDNTSFPTPLTEHVEGMFIYNIAKNGTGSTAVSPGIYYNNGSQWLRMAVIDTNKKYLYTKEYIDPYDFGAILDGITDDAPALQAAINAAAPGQTVKWKGNLAIGSPVNINKSLTLAGGHNLQSQLTILNLNASLNINFPNVTITNFSVINQTIALISSPIIVKTNQFNINRIKVSNSFTGIYTSKEGLIENGSITDCEFINCYYGIYCERISKSYLARNKCMNNIYGGIVWLGGGDNTFEYNTIDGGMFGIGLINFFTVNGFDVCNANNKIINNYIVNCTQYAIGMDIMGLENSAVRTVDVVNTKSIINNQFSITTNYTTNNNYVNAYACFSSGLLKGSCCKILSQNNNNYIVEISSEAYAKISPNDTIIIGKPALNWLVQANTIDISKATTSGINAYGFCYAWKIVGNTIINSSTNIRCAIQILGLNGVSGLDKNPQFPYLYAPSDFNLIANNSITNANILLSTTTWVGPALLNGTGISGMNNRIMGNIVMAGRIIIQNQSDVNQVQLANATSF